MVCNSMEVSSRSALVRQLSQRIIIQYFICICFINTPSIIWTKNWVLAFLATLFLSLTPYTEAVANIKRADDLIVFNLCIGAYLLLFKYLSTKNSWYFLLSVLLIGLSYFAKESTLTLVISIPFIFGYFRDFSWKRALILSSIYSIPSAVYGIVRIKVLGKSSNYGAIPL